MSQKPDISVIVPTYQSESTLTRTLQSLIVQRTDAAVEIVVTDDGSTDETIAIARRYKSEYPDKIRLFTAERNRGLVTNYFEALEKCRGRYITDCAADDFWLGTDSLDRKYRKLEEHPDAVAVYSPWEEVDSSGVSCLRPGFGGDIISGTAGSRHFMSALLRRDRPAAMHLSTVLYRVEVIRDALARRSEMIRNVDFGFEDMPIMLALTVAGDILYDSQPSLAYSVGQSSISNDTDTGRSATFSINSSRACLRLARYYGIADRAIRKSLRHHLTYALALSRRSGSSEIRRKASKAVTESGIRLGVRGTILRILNLWNQ